LSGGDRHWFKRSTRKKRTVCDKKRHYDEDDREDVGDDGGVHD